MRIFVIKSELKKSGITDFSTKETRFGYSLGSVFSKTKIGLCKHVAYNMQDIHDAMVRAELPTVNVLY